MKKIKTGLDRLCQNSGLQQIIRGNIALLCHSASLTSSLEEGIAALKRPFGERLKVLFSPQHGLVSDVQDNMVESPHGTHPHYQLPVYSLYSETRRPTSEMLKGIDTVLIDLQDVGTRVYTYATTMIYMLQLCAQMKIEVIILDRPNPAGGELVEGNILSMSHESFVGVMPIPMRHGMTMGELAKMAVDYFKLDLSLRVIEMESWRRNMSWPETGLTWVNPSPNLSCPDSAVVFPGSVLFEGTNLSEGRGTTRALEQIGHPAIRPYELMPKISKLLAHPHFEFLKVRPVSFLPTFQKHAQQLCGGHFIHPESLNARTWALGQCLMQIYYQSLGEDFKWKDDGYEYKYDRLAIDYINGGPEIREWIESNGDQSELMTIEERGREEFLAWRRNFLIY